MSQSVCGQRQEAPTSSKPRGGGFRVTPPRCVPTERGPIGNHTVAYRLHTFPAKKRFSCGAIVYRNCRALLRERGQAQRFVTVLLRKCQK